MKVNFVSLRPEYFAAIPEEAQPALMENTRGIVACDEYGEPQGVCVLDSWSANSCQMHLWLKTPMVLRHGFQEEVFDFVFGSGRNKIITVVPSNNEKVLRLLHNKKFGFKELTRIKDGFEMGVDYVVSELKKEDCRYIDHG